MRELFEQNETIILFGEGLVFFSLGFAVWLQRRRATRLTLTSSLIWFATVAFVEAIAVWGYVFVPIQATYLDAEIVDALVILRAIVQTAAFLFLIQFGVRLMEAPRAVRTAGRPSRERRQDWPCTSRCPPCCRRWPSAWPA